MTDVLIYADTFRSPELRHEVPIGIPDPFLYAEKAGVKHIVIGSMEVARLRQVGGYELHGTEEYGADELVAQGLSRAEIREQPRTDIDQPFRTSIGSGRKQGRDRMGGQIDAVNLLAIEFTHQHSVPARLQHDVGRAVETAGDQ